MVYTIITCKSVNPYIMFTLPRIRKQIRFLHLISKGPKYRYPAHIDFNKCRETIASALNDHCTHWCIRERVESNALNNWQLKVFKIIDERVLFYSNNLDLLTSKPKLSF